MLDFDDAGSATSSSATYGVYLNGKHGLGEDLSLLYTAGLAYQQDYGNNPGDFGLAPGHIKDLIVGSVDEAAEEMRGIFDGRKGPRAEMAFVNAGGVAEFNLRVAAKEPFSLLFSGPVATVHLDKESCEVL